MNTKDPKDSPGQLPAPVQDSVTGYPPAAAPPTTPVLGTNGGKVGSAAVWTGTNILGNATDVGITAQGLNVIAPTAPAITLFASSTTPPTQVLQIIAGIGAAYWLCSGSAFQIQASGDIQFSVNGAIRWDISNGYQGALIPGADNTYDIGVSSAAGINTVSPRRISAWSFRPIGTPAVVNGSVAGTATISMPFMGSACRKIIIILQGFNGTANYNFPQAFTYTPGVLAQTAALIAAVTAITTTAVQITTASATNGVIILEGF